MLEMAVLFNDAYASSFLLCLRPLCKAHVSNNDVLVTVVVMFFFRFSNVVFIGLQREKSTDNKSGKRAAQYSFGIGTLTEELSQELYSFIGCVTCGTVLLQPTFTFFSFKGVINCVIVS